MNLWVNRGECEKIESLPAYLFTGAKYIMLNKIKADAVRNKFARHFSRFLTENQWNNTEDYILEVDLNMTLQSHLSKLPPRCKEIFELSRRHHLSITDISDSLQLSHKTVENQLSKALKTLRLGLKELLFLLIGLVFL